MSKLEVRGFYFLLGALVLILWLGRTYRVLAVKDQPGNVTPLREREAAG